MSDSLWRDRVKCLQGRVTIHAFLWDNGRRFRSYGNESWEFDEDGPVRLRLVSTNDGLVRGRERKYRWPLGRHPHDHPSLSDFGL
jgi:nuclear transport factor 2 (NTF2) superfamily protein